MALQNAFGDIALDTSVQQVKTAVDAIVTTLDNGVSVSGSTVALDAPTLAALETINANTGGLTDTQLRATPVPVSGTFWQTTQPVSAASLPLPTGAATQTTLAAIDTKLGGTLTVTGALTDTQLRASAVPVSIQGALGTADTKDLGVNLVAGDTGLVTNTVIHGLSTGGGGSYVDVKVNPSGALAVSVGDSALPTGAATETTLGAINTKLSTAIVDMPAQDTASMPVRISPQKYTDISFSQVGSGLLSTDFTQIAAGAGMTISQSAGNLVIAAGTTVNAEFVARSINSFNGALTLKEVTTLSQRIANNNFFIELVDIIGDALPYTIVNTTTVDVTKTAHGFTSQNVGQRMDLCALSSVGVPMEGVIASIPDANTIRFTVAGWPASGSGTLSLTGWNKVEILYTGTTATNLSFNTRRRGWQNTAAVATINTTASGHMVAANIENGVASLADKTLVAGNALTNRTAWDVNITLPETNMYLQIRARNGTTAPASTTTWTVGLVRVEDYVAAQVSLVSTRQQSSNNSLPVNIVSSATIATTVSGTAQVGFGSGTGRAGFIAGAGIWYDDSATALGANATFTGTSRDLTVTATGAGFSNANTYAQELRVSAESDVTGTLWLEVSRDNTNWRRVKSVATTAVTGGGFYAEIVHRPSWRYARVGYTNGAGAQARFSIGSVLMAV